jgi:hypothetical protein
MAASMKCTAFWDIVPCNLTEVYLHLRGVYCVHRKGNGPETLVYFSETAWYYIPEGSNLHACVCCGMFETLFSVV